MQRADCRHCLCHPTEGTGASVHCGTHRGPRSTPQWILRDNLVLEESEVRCGFLAVRGLSTPHPGVLGPTVYL